MRKQITVEGIDSPVILTRRKGSRSLRLTLKSDGTVRVNVPFGIPEFVAKRFVIQKKDWIKQHQRNTTDIEHGMRIGKNHHLRVVEGASTRMRSAISDTEILVVLKKSCPINSEEAQTTIRHACEKALRMEAERLIPQRVEALSKQHDIPYRSCTIQKLKSRWGACDHQNNVSFNSYLMQLDWVLIDYVICHELAHTIHHHHQDSFWKLVERLYPKYKTARKVLKTKRTEIVATTF